MPIAGLDHVALPTADGERFMAFYKRLGFTTVDEDEWMAGRYPIYSLACGNNKINVHPDGFTANLRGPTAVPGCGDLCFVWEGGYDALTQMLEDAEVPLLHGPVDRQGGRAGGSGTGVSVYVRDPDQNLVEFICYDEPPVGRVR
jgi:catechol 2,3-dioxygenase-like lactoylglutathione lyase family enzyme